jgi:hypothetical protein
LLLSILSVLILEVADMAGFVDRTVLDIDGRIEDLKSEMTKLQSARLVLAGRGPGRPATTESVSGARAGRHGARSRRRRGATRGDQALALVREHPGTIPEIASSMGTEPNYLYRVMPHLVMDGKVKRDGQGWHPTETA